MELSHVYSPCDIPSYRTAGMFFSAMQLRIARSLKRSRTLSSSRAAPCGGIA